MNADTLATRYYVTRDPESEFPELTGLRAIIINEDLQFEALRQRIIGDRPKADCACVENGGTY